MIIGMKGFTLGQKIEDKCGMRASMTAELVFNDVIIPSENIVGTINGATLCMMRNLEIERITLAAMSLGIARRCIEIMSNYSKERKAFGKVIGDYGQVTFTINTYYLLLLFISIMIIIMITMIILKYFYCLLLFYCNNC